MRGSRFPKSTHLPPQAAVIRQYLRQQAALDQRLELERQNQLATDAAALSSAFAASAVGGGGLAAGPSAPVGSVARSLPGLRGQQPHFGSYTTAASALSAVQQQVYLNQMLASQQAESASYQSPQHVLRALGSGGATYAASPSLYDPYQSPQRPPRQASGGASGSVQASPYSALSPAGAAGRQYSQGGSVGGAYGSGGAYRRSSYSSQIPHVPEDEPLSNFSTAGQPPLHSRRPSGRNGSESASMPDPAEWDPLYRFVLVALSVGVQRHIPSESLSKHASHYKHACVLSYRRQRAQTPWWATVRGAHVDYLPACCAAATTCCCQGMLQLGSTAMRKLPWPRGGCNSSSSSSSKLPRCISTPCSSSSCSKSSNRRTW